METSEFGCHVVGKEGADADVNDVACDEYEVGLFCVDEVDPAGEFGSAVVVAEMKVAEHEDAVVTGEGFGGGEGERYALFVAVAVVAAEE